MNSEETELCYPRALSRSQQTRGFKIQEHKGCHFVLRCLLVAFVVVCGRHPVSICNEKLEAEKIDNAFDRCRRGGGGAGGGGQKD